MMGEVSGMEHCRREMWRKTAGVLLLSASSTDACATHRVFHHRHLMSAGEGGEAEQAESDTGGEGGRSDSRTGRGGDVANTAGSKGVQTPSHGGASIGLGGESGEGPAVNGAADGGAATGLGGRASTSSSGEATFTLRQRCPRQRRSV